MNGIRSAKRMDDVVELTVGSGTYHFTLAMPSAVRGSHEFESDLTRTTNLQQQPIVQHPMLAIA